MITSSIFDSRCFFVPIKFSTVKTLWNWLVSLHIKVLLSRAQYKFIFLEMIPVIQLEWTDYRLQFHCDKWQCDWALTLSQASPVNCRRAVVCAVQVRAGAPAWIRLIFTMGNSLHPWVPVSPSIGSKDLTCNESCVKLILCYSDFLISFHWLCFGERGKWSVSFCLLYPIAVTPLVFGRASMSPPSVGGRWQVGAHSFKLLTPLCIHFRSVTLCGWGPELVSPLEQTGDRGEETRALQFSCQPSSLLGLSLPHGSLQHFLWWRRWRRK